MAGSVAASLLLLTVSVSAFSSGITAYACVWYFRRSLFSSARNLFMRGVFPLLGALAMTWAFVQSAMDMMEPDYGYTAFARSAACPSSVSACWRSASP